MSYTITDRSTLAVRVAADRAEAVRLMGDMGVNVYVAVRQLDIADGIILTDEPTSVVVRKTRARAVVDFYLDGTPVYADR